MIRKYIAGVLLSAGLMTPNMAFSEETPQNDESTSALNGLSLSDLFNMKITTGSFLELDLTKSPLSMTIINKDMVKTSGARNMSELLEIYVPGFIYNINKWNGTVWGMRGVINDRNTKILYLVNGHKMNTQARDGFQGETVLGLLGDIERVEVLRGPAGLVYGSGAIAGIINVVTRKADDATSSVSVNTDTDRSKSIEANIYGSPADKQQISVTAGYRQSDGMPTGKSRIHGRSGSLGNVQGLAGGPSDGNLGSTDGDWKFGGNWSYKNFNLYARATRQKETAGGWFITDPWPEKIGIDSTLPARTIEPGLTVKWNDPFWSTTESNRNTLRTYVSDNFSIEGSFDEPIGENSLQLKLGFDRNSTTMEAEKRARYQNDRQYINYIFETFGESRYQASGMFLLKSVPRLQLATGFEYRLDHCGDDMQGRNTNGMSLKRPTVTDIYYNTFSLFAEGFYDITEMLGVSAGGRVDWHTRATMVNPKLALVFRPSSDHSIKLIYQSTSNNGSADNYEYNRYHYNADGVRHDQPWIEFPNLKPDSNTVVIQPAPTLDNLHALRPEKVHSVEFAYVGKVLKNVSFEPSVSWGIVKDLFGWASGLFTTINVGEYQYVNADVGVNYTGKMVQFGVNHTYQRPVNTDPEKQSKTMTLYKLKKNPDGSWGKKDSVNIYGDSIWTVQYERSKQTSINVVKSSVTLDGKNFLNLPTNMTKLFLTYSPFQWMSISTNLRIIWGIPGRKPSLTDPVGGDIGSTYNYFGYYSENEYTGFKDYFMHNVSKKLNAGVNLYIPGDFTVSVNAYNILGIDRHTGDPEKDTYTINTLRLAQMMSIKDRNLYSMDQQAFGATITKNF